MTKTLKEFVRIAAISDIAVNSIKTFEIQGLKIVVCNLEGTFYAVDNRCTHDNGPLGEGELVEGAIECPRHGARFDVKTGKALCLPGVGYIKSYALEVRNGDLWVELPAKV